MREVSENQGVGTKKQVKKGAFSSFKRVGNRSFGDFGGLRKVVKPLLGYFFDFYVFFRQNYS